MLTPCERRRSIGASIEHLMQQTVICKDSLHPFWLPSVTSGESHECCDADTLKQETGNVYIASI